MEPRLTMMDIAGKHNGALEDSRARLLKGGSWKRQRIVTVLPAGEKVQTKVALSWMGLAFPPNNNMCRLLAEGLEVGEAYSRAIEQILAEPNLSTWEYILTIEHDNTPPWDGVLRLLERMEAHPEFDCIGGLYYTKGEGGVPQIWGDPRDPVLNFRPQPPDPRVPDPENPETSDWGLVECCGTGMGFNLWRMSLFRDVRLRRPWFKTLKADGGIGTQDLYFWQDARKFGYRCAIDCTVHVGHVDETGFAW